MLRRANGDRRPFVAWLVLLAAGFVVATAATAGLAQPLSGGTTSAGISAAPRATAIAPSGAPSASLTVTPNAVVVDNPIQLSAQVTGGTPPYTYTWSGLPPGCAPGNVSTSSCSPTQSGSYPVSVGVRDSAGSSSTSNIVTLTVYTPVSVSLTVSPTSVNTNQSVTIAASTSGGTGVYSYSYSGLPAPCTSSNLSSIQCAPRSPGSYTVSVTVRDSAGNSATSNSASFQVSANNGAGNPGGNGSGANNGGGGFNGSGFSNFFSSLGPIFALAILMGIVAFLLLAILAASALTIAILLARRLPPRVKRGAAAATVACPSCGSAAPAGSKFCPACGKPMVPAGAQ
jgi:hypothetical protein